MKITKFYNSTTTIEDLSKDKVIIKMTWDEFTELRLILELASYKIFASPIEKFYNELKTANEKAKSKWVK